MADPDSWVLTGAEVRALRLAAPNGLAKYPGGYWMPPPVHADELRRPLTREQYKSKAWASTHTLILLEVRGLVRAADVKVPPSKRVVVLTEKGRRVLEENDRGRRV